MHFFHCLVLLAFPVNGAQRPKLVYPRLLEERSVDRTMMMRVHEELTLNLRKASVAAPTLRLLTEENRKTVTYFYNGEEIERDLYEDPDKIATVTVTRDHAGVLVKGLVGPKHRIEPMPFRERSEDGLVPHAIHEIEFDEMMDKTVRPSDEGRNAFISERAGTSPATPIPEEVEIEVFIIADIPHHSHFPTNQALLVYVCITINSANLRFRAATAPRIKLLVTGVEKSQSDEFAVLDPQNAKYMHDDGTLNKLKDYANKKKPNYSNPDLVYLMTNRDLYSTSYGLGAQGLAFVSTVCTGSFVGLGEDKPGMYTGVVTITHELAHILGAEHDGDASRTIGHPGALACPWTHGHLMSYIDKGPEHQQFSTCSLAQMQYVIRNAGPSCWQISSPGHVASGLYPGLMLSKQSFCSELIKETDAIIESISVIETTCMMRCNYYKIQEAVVNGYRYYTKLNYFKEGAALDYTSCGGNKVCIQSRCVERPAVTKKTKNVTLPPSTSMATKKPATTERPTESPGECKCECPCDCGSAGSGTNPRSKRKTLTTN
ncbi:venom metalloproteinase BumaMPs1-like isoform X1 [Dermacentor variabilis]|uniref:venom metalloproteinase BumaMPs1-like isoform X1 n=1 Tax=Dermacentor variabilis TaxID=34621 RepID=UPI003F5C72E0